MFSKPPLGPYSTPRKKGPYSFVTILPFLVFLGALGLWTYELLVDNPVPESVSSAIPGEWKFYLAKGLHISAYASLTLLAAWLPVHRKGYGFIVVGLLLHGIGTEVGQTFTAKRQGSVQDVVLDWIGILIGLIIVELWKWVRSRNSNRY